MPLHKFQVLDTINPTCYEIISKFKTIIFNCYNYQNFNKEIITLNLRKKATANQINTSKSLKILNSNIDLCNIFSENIQLKAILKITLRFKEKITFNYKNNNTNR